MGFVLVSGIYIYTSYHLLVEPLNLRWKAHYSTPIFPKGYHIRGIDVSHYQGDIDWAKVRNASINADPILFVVVKATEGESMIDENFNENFYQAQQNDFIRGAYHFFVPGISGKKQARFFLKQVHLVPGDLPPVLDIEKTGNLSINELRKEIKYWLEIVENHYNVKPIIYTGYKFKQKFLSDEMFNEYPYWIAHYYVEKLEYKGQWVMWQHTDCGSVDGIKNAVDFNIFNGSLEQLRDFTIQDSLEVEEKFLD